MSESEFCVIGIDIAKDSCELAVLPGAERWSSATAPEALGELVQRCRVKQPNLLVCEATGGYEVPVVSALVACMRKLLVIMNAILKTKTPWRFQTT